MGMEFPADELYEILASAKDTAVLAAKYTAEALEKELADQTPVGTSNELAGGWETQGGGLYYTFVNPVEYALAVHNGSRPHQILAKYAKALNVPGYGFFKSVWHPGYVGYPWTINAMATVELQLDDFVGMALQETGATGG